MKTPKFKINDVVSFEHFPKNSIVIARIDYIMYDKFLKRFLYSLDGWSSKFEEEDLTAVPFNCSIAVEA